MISGMPPPKRQPPGEERYSYEEITTEIQDFIDQHPRGTQQRLAEAAFPELAPRHATSAFRHCMDEYQGQRFSHEAIGRIATAAGRLIGRADGAPPGWPFLKWADADAVDGILRALRGSRV